MLPEMMKLYLFADLAATPAVLERLLAGVGDDAAYDRRPDPERFTLREITAHLADWEGVFQERLRQTLSEEDAVFVGTDPGRMARDHDYAHADPRECLARFTQRREETLALIGVLNPGQWERTGTHARAGHLTITEQVVLIAGHDGYHLQQIAQWLTA
jgi:hypothetical protein